MGTQGAPVRRHEFADLVDDGLAVFVEGLGVDAQHWALNFAGCPTWVDAVEKGA
jgi:hypothetical protein